MYKDLRQFVEQLDRAGELIRVSGRVDPVLEVGEITDRFAKQPGGGKAILFENTGTAYPVITNMMGSLARINMALGSTSLEGLTDRLDALFHDALAPKKNLADKLRMLPMLTQVAAWMPRSVGGRGECQRVRLTGLDQLPILKCWPHDGGRFLTLPLVHTLDPLSSTLNVGMYRMQVFDPLTTGMHWHQHKTGERHYQAYKKLGRRMPVTVCLGGDPAYTYAATAPLPDGINEYMLAGFLRGKPVRMVRCLTNELEVPEDCDFVIEGYVDPMQEKVIEGDFGDHTGFYSLKDLYPEFHVTCITARVDAIYPATLVGIPPQEDAYIAQATERIFMSPIRFAIAPELRNLEMPVQGVAHNIAIASIQKSYPGQGIKVANALWGAGQMMFNKLMIVKSTEDSLQEAFSGYFPKNDTVFQRGTLDVLDHTSPTIGFGGKIAMDLTRKLPQEGLEQPRVEFMAPGALAEMVSVQSHKIVEQWHAIAVTSDNKYDKCTVGNELLGINNFVALKLVVIFDEQVDFSCESLDTLIWLTVSNADAVRDTTLINNTLVVDARTKYSLERGFPNVVTMSREVIERIDDRWAELGLGEFIASPSLNYLRLVKSDSAKIE